MAFLNAHIRITGSLLIEHLEENTSNSCLCSTPVVITQLDSRHNVFRITELRANGLYQKKASILIKVNIMIFRHFLLRYRYVLC